MVRPTSILLALVVGATPPSLGAQSWRTLDVARQLHDSSALQVKVHYGSGKLAVNAATAPLLYDMHLRYDASRTEPVHVYAGPGRTVELGVRRRERRFRGRDDDTAELRLGLARTAPLDLSFDLGAVEGDLDLSGLRLSRLRLESGASEASVRFDTPNPIGMSSLELEAGAASLTALRLANANARDIRVSAGVGNVDLDFGGEWSQDVTLDVDVSVGAVTVHVPSEVGVRVELKRVLASFDQTGLTKRGDAFYSDNWDSAPRKLRITGRTTLGRFALERR